MKPGEHIHSKLWPGVFALALLLSTPLLSLAQTPSDQQLATLSFDQKLDAQLSLNLPFRDETGKEIKLGEYFGKKPVILVLGYYECPMLCTLILNGMVEALGDLKWSIGDQFAVVNVSINPREIPGLAAAKKRVYLKRYGRKGAAAGWHFLTGDEASIRQLAHEVGFSFLYDAKSGQYAHPSGLIFVTPEGKVARYQFGVAFQASEVFKSLQQARSGQAGSTVQKLALLCFYYNPISGKYGPAIMLLIRILAIATLGSLCWTVWALVRGERTKGSAKAPSQPEPCRRVTP